VEANTPPFACTSAVADVTPSGIPIVKGDKSRPAGKSPVDIHAEVIVAGYPTARKTLPIRAGLNKFLPVPPNISLPTITPNTIPTATIQRGIPGGRIRGNINPVTRNPSFTSSLRTKAKITSVSPPAIYFYLLYRFRFFFSSS